MIALDTNVIMDLVSGDPWLVKKAKTFLLEIKEEEGVISSALCCEITFLLSRKIGEQAAYETLIFLDGLPHLEIVSVTQEIAILAGRLRNKYYSKTREISYLDCIHLATAITSRAKRFITADHDFEGVEELPVEIYR